MMADILGWDDEKKDQQIEALEEAIEHATVFTQ